MTCNAWAATSIGALTLLAALAGTARAEEAARPAAPAPSSAATIPAPALDNTAQSFIRKLPTEALKTPPPKRFSSGDYQNPRTALVLDEIRVYGQVEPEDYTRRKPAMTAFRERLERDRPLSIKEKAQRAMCFIGLCARYGPDGAPVELGVEERNEANLSLSTLQRGTRGTLQ